jgi:HK97 family phage major capsid protein/HK97 family phage prohead protease
MDRAYSFIEVKSVDAERRIIEGIASTPTPDRMGDIVEPEGAEFKLPMPLLWQHRHSEPVGNVLRAKATSKGIQFTAQFAQVSDPGRLKERLDEAWQSLKAGLVSAVSIGFREIETSIMNNGGIRFLKWEWLELSLVTIPANAEATIQSIKSIDRNLRAASGTKQVSEQSTIAGVAASRNPVILKETTQMTVKTIAEQRAQLEATLAAKTNARQEIQTKAISEGRTKKADEKEQFDTLTEEIDSIASELKDLETIELSSVVKKAKSVEAKGEDDASASRNPAGRTTVLGPTTPKGIAFARYVKCLFNANNNPELAAILAERHYPDDKRIANYARLTPEQKAAVPAAYTGGSGWADVIAAANVSSEFIEYLRARTIIDRFGQNGVPALRRVPFNIKVSRMTTGLTGNWVGEALPVPVSKGVFDTVTMGKTKVAAISYMSKEQLMFSAVSADEIIRNDLAAAAAAKMDSTFVSTAAVSAGVSPAGLLNGLSAIAPTGTGDPDDIRADLGALYIPFSAAQISRRSIVIVTNENLANALSLSRSALGIREFPDVTMEGGSFEGYPLIPSNHVAAGDVIAISAPNILLADDGEVDVSVSDQASIETLDGSLVQTGQVGTGASLVSLWQTESVGIKITRMVNWQKAQAAAVAFIGVAAWNGAPSA